MAEYGLHILYDSSKDSPDQAVAELDLGGIVVKAAMIEANIDTMYRTIAEATKLLIFFATPHRGGNYANIGDVVASIVRTSIRRPNNGLLDALKKDSDTATMRFEQSRHIYERCNIVNFFEGEPYGNFEMIVDKDSATLGLPGSREKQIAMHATHSSICKLESADNGQGRLVLGTIVQEIDRALGIECTLPTTKNVHWLVERSINPMFTGRRGIISKIKNAFASSRLDVQKRFVLTGMGGQGKSEVCLKVANELRDQFWGVFWVDVSSESTAKSGLSNIAKLLGSTETGNDGVRLLLSNIDPNHPWLLVLDNADDPQVDYQQYLPSGTRGTVLITSRNPECQRYATIGNEDLGSLDKEDCIDLLLQAARLDTQPLNIHSDAQRVIEILGSHTLAILQAGAYIAQALEASAEILESLQSESARDSLCLLQVLSPLHYESVPLDIFERAHNGAQIVREYPKLNKIDCLTDEHVSQIPDFLEPRNNKWDSYRLSEAIKLLESLALIRKGKVRDCSMEELLEYIFTELHVDPAHVIEGYETIYLWRARIASRCGDPKQSIKILEQIVHLNLLKSRVDGVNFKDQHITQCDLACAYLEDWQTGKGIDLLQRTILIGETKLDKMDPDLIFAERRLGSAYLQNNQVEEAINQLEQVAQIYETFDKTHPERLSSQHELAKAYLENGQIHKAIDILKQVVQIKETTLNKTHPERLNSQHELAKAYLENGQIHKAIDILEEVVQIWETTLDKTNLNRLVSQRELARAYLYNKQLEKAIGMFEEVVQIQETTLDKTNLNRLVSQHELARAYLYNKQLEKAIGMFEEVIRIREKILEETNPDRLSSQFWLAEAYLRNGQVKRAIDLFEQVAQIDERTLDETDPDRIATLEYLAKARSADAENAAGILPATPDVSAERPSLQKSKRWKVRHVISSRIRALVGNRLSNK
ncbi:hypothetical protein ABKA04_007370 [Annulohypoxylon sp. FPYF3050]